MDLRTTVKASHNFEFSSNDEKDNNQSTVLALQAPDPITVCVM